MLVAIELRTSENRTMAFTLSSHGCSLIFASSLAASGLASTHCDAFTTSTG
jgi:hypothetical protein